MAIFARLFCMVVSLVVFSSTGAATGFACADISLVSPTYKALGVGLGGVAGAFLGLVIGKYSGEWVAGPPPKN